MSFPPSLELATAIRHLPSYWRGQGPIREIMLAHRFGYADPLWPKSYAVYLALQASMDCSHLWGKGSRAAKRAARAVQAAEEASHAFNRQMALKRSGWQQAALHESASLQPRSVRSTPHEL